MWVCVRLCVCVWLRNPSLRFHPGRHLIVSIGFVETFQNAKGRFGELSGYLQYQFKRADVFPEENIIIYVDLCHQ